MMAIVEQYYWFVLAGAAFLAFLIGIMLRGMMGAAKARRAVVERDVAMTELDQVRSELDSLYAAQRKQKETAAAASGVNPEEVRARDERFAKVSEELEAAKAELETLKSSRQDAADAPPAGPAEADEELKSRNAWLEERVGELEAKIHEMGQAAPAAAPAEPEEGDESSKAAWQINFLKSRVEALEEKLVESEAAGATAEAPKSDPAVDEELARLRWRNRYLEGRLAYFEEAPAKVEEAEAETDDAADGPVTPEIVPETAAPEDIQPAAEPNPASAEAGEESEHPSEKMLRALDASEAEGAAAGGEEADEGPEDAAPEAEDAAGDAVEGEAPPAMDAPDGEADDLTLITGIGPRIQSILNDHGIWHFSQIADWSAANEAWIDEQLNFAGRVGREGWVHQARELVAANANPA